MPNFIKHALLSLFFIVFISSCKKKDNQLLSPVSNYNDGIFIVNEGIFNTGSGTISFYNRTTKTVASDIFKASNGFPLGNIVQSMNTLNNRAFIVVNNAGKVEVTDIADFKMVGTITGVLQPRYFLGLNSEKAYISEWIDGSQGKIAVIDPMNLGIKKIITTGIGAEQMLQSGKYVYVCNAGGFDASFNSINDSTVALIQWTNDSVIQKINVNAYNPSAIVQDYHGKIWVLCSGTFTGDAAHLVRIDTAAKAIDLNFTLSGSFANKMVVNSTGTRLFYLFAGKVFSQDVDAVVLNTIPVINRNFYGLGVDPKTDYLYCSDARDFISNGWVIRYDTNALQVDSFEVGINPGNFYFR
jgi:DNA-binding beta-propeller fold protein YncE